MSSLILILVSSFAHSEYIFSPDDAQKDLLNASAAHLFCADLGLHLVSIHNDTQFNEIKQAILQDEGITNIRLTSNYYIGLQKNGTDKRDSSNYFWTDGTPFDYGSQFTDPPWANFPEEPSLDSPHACTRLHNNIEELKWDDVNCTSATRGVWGRAICFDPNPEDTISSTTTTTSPTTTPTYTTSFPSVSPSEYPSTSPTDLPTSDPTMIPSDVTSPPSITPTPNPSESPTRRSTDATSPPSISPTSSPNTAFIIEDTSATDAPISEHPAKNTQTDDKTILYVIIACGAAAVCFCIAGMYLLLKAKNIQKDRKKINKEVTILESRTSEIGLTSESGDKGTHLQISSNMPINIVKSTDELDRLSAPNNTDKIYKDSMNEGDGNGAVLPLTTHEKKKVYRDQDIETGALDIDEDDDSDNEDGPLKRPKKVTLGGDNSNSYIHDKGKRKKKSTVGGDDGYDANINRDEFVIDGDEDEDEDNYENGDEFGRKVTAGYDDEEEHDGIISDANSDNDNHNQFVIEGGIDENKPLYQHEPMENQWNGDVNTAQANVNVGRESFVVVENDDNHDDINIFTPQNNDMTENGY